MIFFGLPIWAGVFSLFALSQIIAGYVFWRRVIRPISQGKKAFRFDQIGKRIWNVARVVFFQQKVLQRILRKDPVTGKRDMAGLGHVVIFWGFLLFVFSYLVFIFGNSIWRPFAETLLRPEGVSVYITLLEFVALLILASLGWALTRRWVFKTPRLRFDLTRSYDAIIVVALIGTLMVSTLLTHTFFVTEGGSGPEANGVISKAVGEQLAGIGFAGGLAATLQDTFWWLHFLVILSFSVYIPLSKHMHVIAAPLNAFFHSLKPSGVMEAIKIDPENENQKFGANAVKDFTWKQLLDGYACAVCGRCTDAAPQTSRGRFFPPCI